MTVLRSDLGRSRHRLRCHVAACFAVWMLVAAPAAAQSEPEAAEPNVPAIASFADYWLEGLRHTPRPIRLEMVVNYYDPAWGNLWGDIGGEVGYMPFARGLQIRSFDRIRLEGTVVPADGIQPDMVAITTLERDVPVKPLDMRDAAQDSERLRSCLVTCEAILNTQKYIDDHLEIGVVVGGMSARVFHWVAEPKLLDLEEGAIVRLTGVYNARGDARASSHEVDLWVGRKQDIEVVGNLASDPIFDSPVSTTDAVLQSYLTGVRGLHVAGVVRSYTPGQGLTLRDHTGQVLVRTLQRIPVKLGDIVEAVGDPFTGAGDWLLLNSMVRRATPAAAAAVTDAINAPRSRLRLVDAVLALTAEEAEAAWPVELTGTVVWASPSENFIFFRDTSSGIRVLMGDLDSDLLKTGAGIRLSGVTVPGSFVPEVKATRWEFWGNAATPEARLVTLDQAMTGREEGERVEMRGHVVGVDGDERIGRLAISAETGNFTCIVNAPEGLPGMVGSIVSVRGVCRAVANARQQLTGIEVWVANGDDIRVEQAAPEDPFAVPLRKIRALRQFNPDSELNHWARVEGVVTHHVPGRFVFMQDGTDGLLVLTPEETPFAPGDVIQATGLPGLDSQRIVLRESVCRKVDSREQPAPLWVLQAGRIDEELENRLVSVEGKLINTLAEGAETVLALQAVDTVFSARIPGGRAGKAREWLPGSEMEITGVYQINWDERRQPRGFQLQLRSDADVAVLRKPSWLTPGRALMVVGALGGCLVIGLGWVALLRRRVSQQTEQIRTQVAKEANLEARHRDIFENASDFIFTTDREGRFTSFNPAGERITGFTREEALVMNLRDLIAPEDASEGLLRAMDAGEDGTVTFQSRFTTKDGRVIWTETSARLVNDTDGFSGVLGVVRDISERKQIEEELKRARDAAEANTQAKSAFLANMSHEIRTPMNGVIGMSNLLLETPLREDQREFAETIRNSAEALLTVLNDILDFSKIEAGKLHFETLDFDLEETVDDALELLAARATAKGLELAAFMPPEIPRKLRGDPGRLRQVLLNLLGNAVKFTDQGEVIVTVSLVKEEETRACVRVEVRDTGIGMAPEAVEQLFQPFVQADSSTTRRFGGTGLGLAISRQIIEMMNGRIHVNSEPGLGSTFWFEASFEKQAAAAESGEPEADIPPNLRILAVDDHGTNRRLIHFYADTWKVRCDTVESPAEVIAMVHAADAGNDPYGLVLLDLHMPEMDGLALARNLTLQRRGPRLPMILLTSLDRRFDYEQLAAIGIVHVLTKPIRQAELRRSIARATAASAEPMAESRLEPLEPAAAAAARAPLDLRVLIAEDNAVNQRLTQLQLKKLGCVSDVAANGLEVLEALERADYDVVLMDCQMPEMDGYEATRRLRKSGRFGSLRVVAMTANAMEGDRDRCLEAGMDDYLSKPTRMDDMRTVLERCVRVKAAAG